MNIYAIIVAAGKGTRMGTQEPKQLLPYKGSTVVENAVIPFLMNDRIQSVFLVIPEDCADKFNLIKDRLRMKYSKSVYIIYGGKTRQDSVMNGLLALEKTVADFDNSYVLIHDGARPGVTQTIINNNIEALKENDAVVTAVHTVDSIRISSKINLHSEANYHIIESKTLDRNLLYNVQTPQSFKLSRILEAYKYAYENKLVSTDDAGIAEAASMKVKITEGAYSNKKITTREDLPMETRVGNGYDVHRLVEGRKLILCGAPVPNNRGLLGHSDADVATHALIDAILGAAGKGDIGKYFPDTDERYKDADSLELLSEVMKIVDWINVVNVDITIIAEEPKLAPYIEMMKKNIANILSIPLTGVNIKATTTEGLGFTGRGEGIAALATCTIEGRL